MATVALPTEFNDLQVRGSQTLRGSINYVSSRTQCFMSMYNGTEFTSFNIRPNGIVTAKVLLFIDTNITGSRGRGALYWCDLRHRVRVPEQCITIISINKVTQGHSTPILSRGVQDEAIVNSDEKKCLSIYTSKGSLDLEARTLAQCAQWLYGLRELLIDVQRFKPSKLLSDDSLRVKTTLPLFVMRALNSGTVFNRYILRANASQLQLRRFCHCPATVAALAAASSSSATSSTADPSSATSSTADPSSATSSAADPSPEAAGATSKPPTKTSTPTRASTDEQKQCPTCKLAIVLLKERVCLFYCADQGKAGSFYWCAADRADGSLVKSSCDVLQVQHICSVGIGHCSPTLSHALSNNHESLLFRIEWRVRGDLSRQSLELEAASANMRNVWVHGISRLLFATGRTAVKPFTPLNSGLSQIGSSPFHHTESNLESRLLEPEPVLEKQQHQYFNSPGTVDIFSDSGSTRNIVHGLRQVSRARKTTEKQSEGQTNLEKKMNGLRVVARQRPSILNDEEVLSPDSSFDLSSPTNFSRENIPNPLRLL